MSTNLPSFIETKATNPMATFIFAHGAGADKSHHFMETFTQLLVEEQITVIRFNFPYMDKRLLDGKKYLPNKMPLLEESYRAFVRFVNEQLNSELPLFIGGKSMGGRVAAILSADKHPNVKGTVCIGYPFHPSKKPEKLRLVPLQETQIPTLILQGDRDTLGNKSDVQGYVISSLCEVVYFDDADHDLKPRIKSGFTHKQHLTSAAKQVARFIHEKS